MTGKVHPARLKFYAFLPKRRLASFSFEFSPKNCRESLGSLVLACCHSLFGTGRSIDSLAVLFCCLVSSFLNVIYRIISKLYFPRKTEKFLSFQFLVVFKTIQGGRRTFKLFSYQTTMPASRPPPKKKYRCITMTFLRDFHCFFHAAFCSAVTHFSVCRYGHLFQWFTPGSNHDSKNSSKSPDRS